MLTLVSAAVAADQGKPPNVIIIMADDMGYAGLSCTGNPFVETPRLDRLAAQGLRFTDFHSSGAVCSPTRAGLLTGRYQQRTGVDVVVNANPRNPAHHLALQHAELTFAEALKQRGYATGLIGKWHVGYDPKHNPITQGFDTFRGFVSGNVDYISHYDNQEAFDWWHDAELNEEPGYTTHLINRHAVEFIERHKDGPFCLYVAHQAIHNPNQGPNDPPIRGPNKRPAKELQPVNDAVREMTQAMDAGVGQIVDKLEELGIADRTLVWFFSDNGGTSENRSTGPLLRGNKGTVWEGGHRVPAIAWWPGRIEAGRTTDALAITLDVMPTMLALAGAELPEGHGLDGVNLAPLLLRGEPPLKRALCWKHGKALALRDGPWKLVVNERGLDGDVGLYHLGDDLAERNNLAAEDPKRVKALRTALDAWLRDVTESATPQPGRSP